MKPEQFCYWIQGFSEAVAPDVPTEEQWTLIRDHLSLVFEKLTPTYVAGQSTVPMYHGRDLNPGAIKLTC